MEVSLIAAVAIYVVIAGAAGLLGVVLSRKLSHKSATAISALAVALLLGNAIFLADSAQGIRVLPVENVWLWSNPTLPGAAFLASLVWPILPPIRWQRTVMVVILLGLGVHRSLSPLYSSLPHLGPDRWSGETCRQSTKSTCAPAAAAAALATQNIRTTEAELARLELTMEGGTSQLGLYRALHRLTRNTPTGITVYRGDIANLPTPAIVSLAPKNVGTTLIPIGGRHAIAVLRRNADGSLAVADPYAGTQRWTDATLASLWTGSAFVLSPKPSR